MLISKTVILGFYYNVELMNYYREKGYDVGNKTGDKFEVRVEDLSFGSNAKVLVSCDFCKEVFTKKWCKYLAQNETGDCCYNCRHKKINYLFNLLSKDEQDKILQQANEKRKNTCLIKFGEISNSCLAEQKEKVRKTNLERYGVEHYTKTEEFKEKKNKTNIEKYGFDNPMKNRKVVEKVRKTLYENGNCPASKAQIHVAKILNGELNYPYEHYNLDVFFKELNIYIEYNGSGHDLHVKHGRMTQEEFENFSHKRYQCLKRKGLKLIRFDNFTDKLPPDKKIIELFKIGIEYLLKEENYFIVFDLDKLK